MQISKREQNKINVRQSILKASRKLFTSNGFDNTMMEDIARKADVSKATVYNYFPNKESLLIGIERELILQITDMVNKNPKKKNNEALLRQVLETLVQASAEYWDIAKYITYLNSCEDSALYDTRNELEALIIDLIKKAQEEGTFKADSNPEQMADMIMGIFLISLFQWEHIDRYTPKQISKKLNQAFDTTMADYYS